MAEMKTPSSFDGVDRDPTSAADEKDAGGGVGGVGQRAPAAGREVGRLYHPRAH